MRVLVIAEDYRLDQYILKPFTEALMAAVGQPNAKVQMCMDPHYTGVDHVLQSASLQDVVETNPMADLYFLVVDRDGNEGREQRVDNLINGLQDILKDRQAFVGALAWQEVEVWLLAAHDLPAHWVWADVRGTVSAKEDSFDPFSEAQGVNQGPGRGRKALGEAVSQRYARVRQLCDEVAELETRIRDWLAAR